MVKKMTNEEMEAFLKANQKVPTLTIVLSLFIKWCLTIAIVFGVFGLAIAAVTWVVGMLV